MINVLVVIAWTIIMFALAGIVFFSFTKFGRALLKIPAAAVLGWLAQKEIFFDEVPEGYATAYESGGKFIALACSYKGFGPVKAPGDLDWAIRRVGDKEVWPKWTDEKGVEHPEGEHVYANVDFHWDRRLPLVKKVFGDETGIVWMGLWPMVKPKYYSLRLNNFRTVKPDEGEIEEKHASVREYLIGEKDDRRVAGWLVSWNEWTKRVLLSDDIYPFPVDGVRIGTRIITKPGEERKKPQAVTANILPFVRARIQEPYLFLYRVEDALELIQNEIIQHIRQLCAGLSIEGAFALEATLESEKAGQENTILMQNDFRTYMGSRYGFRMKGASFGYIDITGKGGDALAAPYIAQQEAEAVATSGEGEGRAESTRLTLEGAAFKQVISDIGADNAVMLRAADVAERFARDGKASTVVLGFDPKTILSGLTGGAGTAPPKPKNGGTDETSKAG